ncbi:Uncharacterized protein GBIM_04369, partial [Gryllus bimaculatus]
MIILPEVVSKKCRQLYPYGSKSFIREVKGTWKQSGHKASLPQLEFCGSVIYSSMLGECGFACEEILEENSHLDEIILGFDTEWPVTYRSNESSSSRTSLIQICAQKEKCYLFHVNNLRRLPLAMIHLMEHPKTKLVGVNITSDLWKLGRDFDISVKSIIETKVIDLGKYANEVLQCSQNWSLAGLVLHVLKMDINKDITVRKRRMDYRTALKLQYLLASNHKNPSLCEKTNNTLVLIEHDPVYTVGIRDKSYSHEDEKKLKALGAEFHRTNRGGLITFHGPGQLVVYPIINLKEFKPSMRWYVSQLENTVIALCKKYDITASTSPHTGVWVEDRKICAIGIHGSRFVTTHGIALNCSTNLEWFSHIVPCGIEGKEVTSLTNERNELISIENAIPIFLSCFSEQFN